MRNFESLPAPPSWSDHFQSGPLITLAPPLKFCFVTAQHPTTSTSFFAASSDGDTSADAEAAAGASANAPGARVTTSPTWKGTPFGSSALGLGLSS